MVSRYRKKPVIIEAIKLERTIKSIIKAYNFLGKKGINGNLSLILDGKGVYISTLEGDMLASWGDMIIKGVSGEFYPCKEDIFFKTYDKVNELDDGFRKDDDTFTYGEEIKGPRRSGKTTRMINDIVEKLFLGKKVMIYGSALNEKLVQILQSRMAIEHSLSYHKKGKIPLGKIIRIEDFNSLKFKKDI